MFLNWKEWLLWIALSLVVFAFTAPGSIWYDSGRLVIPDYTEDSDPEIRYDGGTKREFKGAYSITVRDAITGEIEAEGPQSAYRTYKVEAKRPDPLLLSWWVGGNESLMNLPKGLYRMEVCWSIVPKILPKKTVCTFSNQFRVIPNE